MISGFGRQAAALACFLFVAALIPSGVLAHTASIGMEGEHIEQFDVVLEVGKRGEVEVTETIRYNFGREERHGIYRDIPFRYVAENGGERVMPVDVQSVTDASGVSLQFEEVRTAGYLRVKIGDPDRLITGSATYVIRYEVRDAISYFDEYDELYWNATGNDWTVPIEAASVNIRTLEPTTGWKFVCYVGPRGSTENCSQALPAGMSQTEIRVDWDQVLPVGSGITVALGFDKGYIHEPTRAERILAFIWDNMIALLPVAAASVMGGIWYRRGRDPKGHGVIVPEYDVPEHLSTLELASLERGKLANEGISAAIIDLAVQGYIRMEKTVEDRFLMDRTDYILHRLEKDVPPDALEATLLKALFNPSYGGVDGKAVRLSSLKNRFYAEIPELEEKTFKSLVAKRYYVRNPLGAGKYVSGSIIFFAILFVGLTFTDADSWVFTTTVGFSFVAYLVFAWLMPQMTREGVLMKERIRGLCEYLQIAEKRRIEFHNAPEKTPELFERLLPAALILGVSDIWAREFQDIYTRPPEWYSGSGSSGFSAGVFAMDMGGFSSAAASTLSSAPAPSGSGSGGGGSSGGGGGGGGGGSW